jgi:Protein of unknown function (DUF3105)
VKTATTALERVAIVVISLALSVGLIALMSGYFTGHDPAQVSVAPSGPGQGFPDLGHTALRPGQQRPAYNSYPPTSGPHLPQPVSRNGARLSDDQLLQALQAGNVVLMYGGPSAPASLRSLARAVAPPFSAALSASGQAVILAWRPRTSGVIGLAWTHLIRAQNAADPELRAFASFWLGRGAPGR